MLRYFWMCLRCVVASYRKAVGRQLLHARAVWVGTQIPRYVSVQSLNQNREVRLYSGRGESGWCSDVTSTHGAWRHARVRFLLPGVALPSVSLADTLRRGFFVALKACCTGRCVHVAAPRAGWTGRYTRSMLAQPDLPCAVSSIWVHSSVVRAADCRSAGPWFKSGCALLLWRVYNPFETSVPCGCLQRRKSRAEGGFSL